MPTVSSSQIVMKCLEKDRRCRYETANGLAMDIKRHLNHEPVVARPPSAMYRLGKTWARNRLALSGGLALGLALVAGLVGTSWQAARALRAEREQIELRQQAEGEAARSAHVAAFLREMLEGVGPSVALGRDTTMLREILDKTSEGLIGLEVRSPRWKPICERRWEPSMPIWESMATRS